MKHILSSEQFSYQELLKLFNKAEYFKDKDKELSTRKKITQKHKSQIMISVFYEPSTRTRFSFEIAAAKLGIDVICSENAAEFSSSAKGESIEDTIKVLNNYGVDVILIRSAEIGFANRAAKVSSVPIINAGDGMGEHPTQSALDLYTIYRQYKRLENLVIVIGGDLQHSRTARSLALVLSKFKKNKIIFVSSTDLAINNEIIAKLKQNKTNYLETTDMIKAFEKADVVYWTRLQKERIKNLKNINIQNDFIINQTVLNLIPKKAIIMHALPRQFEIPNYVDKDRRAKFFEQAGNGLYIRMALLDDILS